MAENQKTTRKNRFNNLHTPMIRLAKEKLGLPNIREYYRIIYGWVDDFSKDIEKLEEYDQSSNNIHSACNLYLSTIHRVGLRKLGTADENSYIDRAGKIILSKEYYKMPKNAKQRNLACTYLKNLIKDYGLNEENVNEIITVGINAIDNPALKEQFENIRKKRSVYEIWTLLLIYAQDGKGLLLTEPEATTVNIENNIYMHSKKIIEATYSLSSRIEHAKRITLINYAGSSFITGQLTAPVYSVHWGNEFNRLLAADAEVVVVLTDPASFAAQDAIKYKMRPQKLRLENTEDQTCIERIIPGNIAELKAMVHKYPDCNLAFYITDIALPCAYFRSEFEDINRDNIKIDLYLPTFAEYGTPVKKNNGTINVELLDISEADDIQRQSFMIFKNDNPELYTIFSRNMDRIIEHSTQINLKEI